MRRFTAIALLTLFCASGCADKQAPPPEVAGPPKATLDASATGPDAKPDNRIKRPVLDAVLSQGPAWLLQRVPVEEVVNKGKFVGWRVLELPADWGGVPLRPGDVVTSINAMPLEKPDDFWAAWTTLTVASEVKVAYNREGEAQELRIPIEGSPNPALSKHLKDQDKTPPKRSRRPRQKKTVVIQSKERPLSDTLVDWSQ